MARVGADACFTTLRRQTQSLCVEAAVRTSVTRSIQWPPLVWLPIGWVNGGEWVSDQVGEMRVADYSHIYVVMVYGRWIPNTYL